MIDTVREHLRRYWPVWTAAILTVLYLLLQYHRFYNILSWADTDDALQYVLSRHIFDGNWLGPYNRLTLIKGVGFPIWAALLHSAHVPLWLGNGLLLIAACSAMVYALKPFKLRGWQLLGIYTILLFNPMTTPRIYRDDIIPALVILLLAWAIGIFSYLTTSVRQTKAPRYTPLLILTGVGCLSLPAWNCTREDGIWLMPFIAACLLLGIILFTRRSAVPIRNIKRPLLVILLLLVLPFAATFAAGTAIASMNKHYYGRYVVNDYFSPEFESAYAALTRVNSKTPKILSVPVSYDMRQKLYAASPAFKQLQPCLDGTNGQRGFCEGFKETGPNKNVHDYEGGWLPFAIRLAVERNGDYANPSKAAAYYSRVTDEINQACASGKLSCHPAHVVSLMPITVPAIKTALTSNLYVAFRFVATLSRSGDELFTPVGNPQNQYSDQIAQYYGVRYTAVQLGHLGTLRQETESKIYTLYKIIHPIMFVLSVLSMLAATYLMLRRQMAFQSIILIVWLLFAILLLRITMLSYVQTVSFPTIYPLYYSAVYPILFLYEGLGVSLFFILIKKFRQLKLHTVEKASK